MKYISILGSTGSIGTQTLDIVRRNNDIKVLSLAVSHNIKVLEEQIREFSPKMVCVFDEEKAKELASKIKEQQAYNDELVAEKENVNSKEFIEQMAREKLDMYYPNEKVYLDKGM